MRFVLAALILLWLGLVYIVFREVAGHHYMEAVVSCSCGLASIVVYRITFGRKS